MPEDAPKNKDAVSPWPSWSRVKEAMETTKDAVTTVAPHGYSGYDAETGLPSPRIITLPIIPCKWKHPLGKNRNPLERGAIRPGKERKRLR